MIPHLLRNENHQKTKALSNLDKNQSRVQMIINNQSNRNIPKREKLLTLLQKKINLTRGLKSQNKVQFIVVMMKNTINSHNYKKVKTMIIINLQNHINLKRMNIINLRNPINLKKTIIINHQNPINLERMIITNLKNQRSPRNNINRNINMINLKNHNKIMITTILLFNQNLKKKLSMSHMNLKLE